jgi:hypothetical protein
MQAGDKVQVYSAFNDTWARGFEIAEVIPDGFRVRRVSDGAVLPSRTSADDLRPDDR